MSNIKSALLGENFSTASAKLKKALMFSLAQQLNLDVCYRCEQQIKTVAELSVEHKEAWQSAVDPIKSFYDLNNIAFSHLTCNVGAASKRKPITSLHGSRSRYKSGCKCSQCKQANNSYVAKRRLAVGRKS